jgi:protein-S-isoprenylcysteine O-methyltransferase Ste14
MFSNLSSNLFFWLFVYFSFVGIYSVFIFYHQRNPEKKILFFKIINNSGAIFCIILVFAVHLTIQPRVYGSLGTFLTPSNQIMTKPLFNFGVLPSLILSIIGFGMTIAGTIILTITVYKVIKVLGVGQFESKELLDTGFWGIVRNPLYTSLILIYIGMALILGAVYSLFFAPIFYLENWLSGWIEATLNLEKSFGAEKVEEYKKKVPYMLFNKPLWILMLGLSIYLMVLTIWGYVPLY